jgi:16S rRNA (guanine527-N7)-methyltransferase
MKSPGDAEIAQDRMLATCAQGLGVQLRPDQVRAFRYYQAEIIRWSQRMNLTALRTPEDILHEGFLDSLACLPLIPSSAKTVLDVGSGAGFPAIPLAIVLEGLNFTLVEASRKKCTFLKHIVRGLDLRNVRIWCGRAERLGGEVLAGDAYDIALARAVAPVPDQAVLVSPFLRPGGVFLAQVGPSGPDEQVLAHLQGCGFQLANAMRVPPWRENPARRIFAFRWLGQPGSAECFT